MSDIMIILWFAAIIIAALIEINTMDLTSLWFSAGALVAFILALAGLDIYLQVIVFMVVSLLLLISVRPMVKNYLKTNIISTNIDRLVGKVAICTKDINIGERGEVKIDGKYWLAVSSGEADIMIDDKVEVLAIEGVKLVVNRIS
ncbi:MAG: NfeD family protein [Candidatus Izimaplasma sp.]|nr:NfeD family protein [Candidatus Izimaplasma bacterium]